MIWCIELMEIIVWDRNYDASIVIEFTIDGEKGEGRSSGNG